MSDEGFRAEKEIIAAEFWTRSELNQPYVWKRLLQHSKSILQGVSQARKIFEPGGKIPFRRAIAKKLVLTVTPLRARYRLSPLGGARLMGS